MVPPPRCYCALNPAALEQLCRSCTGGNLPAQMVLASHSAALLAQLRAIVCPGAAWCLCPALGPAAARWQRSGIQLALCKQFGKSSRAGGKLSLIAHHSDSRALNKPHIRAQGWREKLWFFLETCVGFAGFFFFVWLGWVF